MRVETDLHAMVNVEKGLQHGEIALEVPCPRRVDGRKSKRRGQKRRTAIEVLRDC